MATILKAGNVASGAQITSDSTGILEIKTGTGSGTTAITVGTDQAVTFAAGTTVSSLTTSGAVSAGSLTVNSNNISAVNSLGFRNRIINGDMRIDQRNAGASVTVSVDNVYAVDRTGANKGGSINNYTAQQSSTAPTGFTKSLLATMGTGVSIGSTDYAMLGQKIEGFNVADFSLGTANSVAFTLSFWVRSSVTGTFGVSFRNSTANATWCSTYTISAANTWEYKTVSVAAGSINSGTWLTDNGTGMTVYWDLGVGSTFSGTANQLNTGANYFGVTGTTKLAATTGATFYITGVQLEAGSVATPFERRDYGRELAMCQRYFLSLTDTNQQNGFGAGVCSGTTSLLAVVSYPVSMRAVPTLTTSGTFQVISSSNFTPSGVTLNAGGVTSSTLSAAITGATNGNAGFLRGNGSAVAINFSSEL
jgi:hypothetical protein